MIVCIYSWICIILFQKYCYRTQERDRRCVREYRDYIWEIGSWGRVRSSSSWPSLLSLSTSHIMVCINLSNYLQLLSTIQVCPCSIPKSMDILFEQYMKFKSTSDYMISIPVRPSLQTFKKVIVDNVELSEKKKIIEEIISIYNNAQVPSVSVT